MGSGMAWYRNAIIYELHVRAFHDSDGDGIGDFRGLVQKLDYLQDLGVTAIWLLPFYPSPLRDDGYDIADYTGVNPSYGSMRDVRRLVREAHKRDLRVITELVLNHTSDQHPWFQRARKARPGSRWRDFYVWSDSPEKYPGVRIIFQDFESSNWTWDPVARSYYWHRFYSHQPDLNFDHPEVHKALFRALDHWLDAGVDGMRLDAVPYLYEREGTNCENLPETHDFLKKLRRHVDGKYDDRMLLAEANQWPEDAVAYFGDGDECHMNFHFPLMPRLFMSLRMEDRFPIVDILDQTPPIPDNCQWAMFLRNHDELTLEMVTDEERDYMYRVYARDRQARVNLGIRRRLAPLLQNNRRKVELMNALLFALPGSPVLYYGDEIGMGDNIYLGDRNAVRTPMQWSSDRNAGFSRANPQQLYLPVTIDPEYHFESVNVEAQARNPSSLLWWMKRLIALRGRYPVFGVGSLEFLHPENPKVVAFIRRDEQHTVLVVANLSRFPQAAELDLSQFRDRTPVEMFGHTAFPRIGELPYFLTVGPHGFYWFSLEREPEPITLRPSTEETVEGVPILEVAQAPSKWFLTEAATDELVPLLVRDLPRRRWFRSKARTLRNVRLEDAVRITTPQPQGELAAQLLLVRVEFAEAEAELYAVPLVLASASHAAQVIGTESPTILARVRERGAADPAVVYDAMVDPTFCAALFDLLARRRCAQGRHGQLAGKCPTATRRSAEEELEVRVPRAEQTNSSVIYGERYILKLYRAIEPGVNPDLEVSRHLSERAAFAHTPPYAGSIEYQPATGDGLTLAMLQGFMANEGDGWRYTLDALGRYYERMLTLDPATDRKSLLAPPDRPLSMLAEQEPPPAMGEILGRYLDAARLLGQRTAEMHAALASGEDPVFAAEPFSQLYRRSLYQSARNTARRTMGLLRQQMEELPDGSRAEAAELVERESEIIERLREVTRAALDGKRIRCHGDFHLGQVLWTGRDFLIIDFEGEPARPLGERRLKWSPLRDVAGMLRSFHYAAHTALRELIERGAIIVSGEDLSPYEPWARSWHAWVGAGYLRAYLATLREARADLLPSDQEGLALLLDTARLEKALYEVAYELNNRPSWVHIPLHGVLEILGSAEAAR